MMFIDARVPLRFGPLASRTADEAVMLDSDLPAEAPVARFNPARGGHAPDCACCVPRSAAAAALAALFRERAVGHGPPFRGVLAVVGPDGEAAVREALANDPVAAGRYRLG
jgi:hypothetical protein